MITFNRKTVKLPKYANTVIFSLLLKYIKSITEMIKPYDVFKINSRPVLQGLSRFGVTVVVAMKIL